MAVMKKLLLASAVVVVGLLILWGIQHYCLPFTKTTSEAVFPDSRSGGTLVVRQTLLDRFSPKSRRFQFEAGFRYTDAADLEATVIDESPRPQTIRVVQADYSFYLITENTFWVFDTARRKITEGAIPTANKTIKYCVGDFGHNLFGNLTFTAFKPEYIRKTRERLDPPLPVANLVDSDMFKISAGVIRAVPVSLDRKLTVAWTPVKVVSTLKAPSGTVFPDTMMIAHQEDGEGIPDEASTLYLIPLDPRRPGLGWKLREDYQRKERTYRKGFSNVGEE